MNKRALQDAILDAMNQEFTALIESMSHDEALSTLGLKDDHSEEDLKAAYRDASKKHHPDVGGSLDGMKRVNAAYEKLKDGTSKPQTRTNRKPVPKSPHPNDHLWDMIHHENPKVRVKAALHPDLQSHHIHAILNSGHDAPYHDEDLLASSHAALNVLKHPKIDTEHLDNAMKHWDSEVAQQVLEHPKAGVDHVDAGMDHWASDVRLAALKHPKVKLRHIEKALGDDEGEVRSAAIQHLRKRGAFED
jgi:hypothetical protein